MVIIILPRSHFFVWTFDFIGFHFLFNIDKYLLQFNRHSILFIILNLVFYYNASIRLFCLIFSKDEGLGALIGNFIDEKEISLQDLALFPAFLRFGGVHLRYTSLGYVSIAEKCDLFDKCLQFDGCLQSIKPALNDSNLIHFECIVSENARSEFSNHQTLIKYISDRLLTICESSRKYSFFIRFASDENSASNIIASILQMSQICRYGCFGIHIGLICTNPTQLPTETISTWLNRNSDAMEIHQKRKCRILHIHASATFQNIPEMCDLLKTVNFQGRSQKKFSGGG